MRMKILLMGLLIAVTMSFVMGVQGTLASDLDPIPGAGWHYPWKDKYQKWAPPKAGVDERMFDQPIEESYGYDAKDVEAIKEYLPEPLYIIMNNTETWGNRRINITPVVENDSELFQKYLKETKKYKGQATVDDKGWLQNYTSGIPFPEPKTGRELLWNFKWRFSPDDRLLCVVNWIVNRRGQTRYQTSDGNLMFFLGRLANDPQPIYKPNPDNLYRVDVYANAHPYEMQGTLSVIKQFNNPDKEDALWMYLPALRRVRHLSTGQRTDRLPGGQDLFWDNLDCFNGNPTDWKAKKLESKRVLAGHNCKPQNEWVKGEHLSGVDQYYQYRDCYVIELTPNDPNYPYQRVLLYLDPDTYIPYYSVWWDQEGKLAQFDWFMYYMTKDGIYVAQVMNHIDMQRIHSTGYAATGPSYNNGFTPDYFSLQNLKHEYPSR